MPKKPTLKQIAGQLGLSVSTVSRVLSGQSSAYRISRKTEQAVLRAARRADYTPNQLARGLRTNRTNTLGLVIPDISNPFFAGIAHRIENEARRLGYSIILSDSNETTELEIESLRLLQSRKVDGMIVFPVGRESAHLAELREFGMPLVITDRRIPGLDVSSVVSDNFTGAYEAASSLLKAGHRVIACIQGLPFSEPSRERVRGFREAHRRLGWPLDDSLIVGDNFGETTGYVETSLFLKRPVRPTAVFATSNLIALGAMRAIREEGLAIPGDVSMIGFDEAPHSGLLATPLTTVAQDQDAIGRLAVSLLFERMRDGESGKARNVVVPTKLIQRESVAPYRG